MTFFNHSGMPRNSRFQNTRFQRILEPKLMSISGMVHIFAFQNAKIQEVTKYQSFLKD